MATPTRSTHSSRCISLIIPKANTSYISWCKKGFINKCDWLKFDKVKSRLCFLYCNRSSFIPAAKLTMIQMTILPMLDYRDIIYRSTGKGTLKRIDVFYHSAIRFATNAPYRTHHCTLYSSVSWSSLYTWRKTHWLMLIYKNPLRPHSPLSDIPTAALILHIQHPFCQSHSDIGPQSTHIPGSRLFSVRCS